MYKIFQNIIQKSNLKDLSVTQVPKYNTIMNFKKMHDLSGTFTNGLHAKFEQNKSPIYSVSVFMVLDTIKLQNM